jgi:hypothetical protein
MAVAAIPSALKALDWAGYYQTVCSIFTDPAHCAPASLVTEFIQQTWFSNLCLIAGVVFFTLWERRRAADMFAERNAPFLDHERKLDTYQQRLTITEASQRALRERVEPMLTSFEALGRFKELMKLGSVPRLPEPRFLWGPGAGVNRFPIMLHQYASRLGTFCDPGAEVHRFAHLEEYTKETVLRTRSTPH